jgi:hypothetical protein
MIRFSIASVMLAGSALVALEPAHGQVVQYQYTPPPPVVPLWQRRYKSGSPCLTSVFQSFGISEINDRQQSFADRNACA